MEKKDKEEKQKEEKKKERLEMEEESKMLFLKCVEKCVCEDTTECKAIHL